MQFKLKRTAFLLLLAFLLSWPGYPQEVRRWLRIPFAGTPTITRHQLQQSDKAGIIKQSRYENNPVRPLLKKLRKYFPELWARKTIEDDTIDISESTLLLESLQTEADEYRKTASGTVVSESASATASLF